MSREQSRVDRLSHSLEDLQARLEANPGHAKTELWRAKCAEYKESLLTFATYGQERPPGAAIAKQIDVPLKKFGLEL